MGACGCEEMGSGGTQSLRQFAGPDGTVYVIELCRPCDYCQTPFGVSVYQLSPEALEFVGPFRDLFDSGQVETWDEGMTHIASLPMLDPWKLRRHVAGEAKRSAEEEALDGVGAEIVVEEIFDEWLRSANPFTEEGAR